MNLNTSIKQLSIACEGLDEEKELQMQIHHAIELLNEQDFMQADMILEAIAKRINYLISNV